MNANQTTTHPYRPDATNMIPIEDYNKLVKALEEASNHVKKLESRNSLQEGILDFFRTLPKRIMFGIVVLSLFYGVFYFCFKGKTHGARSRQIAEREAISYVTRRYGPVTAAVCNAYDLHQQCFVRLADPAKSPIVITCDDDEPEYNDGCREKRFGKQGYLPN
jgi:hypothetical protein